MRRRSWTPPQPAQRPGWRRGRRPDRERALEARDREQRVVGIVAAMIILSLTFGTLVAMGCRSSRRSSGCDRPRRSSGCWATSSTSRPSRPTLATMIGLGVGIDYALFLVTRHRQLARGMADQESIARAVATSGSAVVFAGSTVVIALLSLAVAGIPLVTVARLRLGRRGADRGARGDDARCRRCSRCCGRPHRPARLPSFLRPKPKPGQGLLGPLGAVRHPPPLARSCCRPADPRSRW